ncbi:MAG TPA: hypothetical protein VEI97_02930 [bacterium]|nr:hypothetical protein [bacterium]
MDSWWDGFRQLVDALGAMPDLVALVCLFVVNNALWMHHLHHTALEVTRVLRDVSSQLQALHELSLFQAELLERVGDRPTSGQDG